MSGASRAAPVAPTTVPAQPISAVPGRRPQASLRVSQPSDPYEREADRVADRVMRMTGSEGVMRACACDDDEVSRSAESAAGPGGHGELASGGFSVGRTSVAPTGAGRPLDPGTRSWAEGAFGHDFSQVRVHTGSRDAGAAADIGARAYTLGRDIVFGSGHYRPNTSDGRRLLAHELTHVVQQRGSADRTTLQRQPAVTTPQQEAARIQRQLILRMCMNPVTQALVERIHADGLRILLFEAAYDKWEHDDGTITENELPGLRGNTCVTTNLFCTEGKTIRLNKSLSIEDMMLTLLHEMQHWIHSQDPAGPRSLESEIQARIATEQFAIDTGRPPTRPSYRTADGQVDEAAIRAEMAASPHYSPTGRTRIGRRYVGDLPMPGEWICPPIGDFPDPGRVRSMA